jgi:hypothetical protein
MKKHPESIPRNMFWSSDVGGISRCPECKGSLENEHHTYVFATREGEEIDTFIVGSKCGYFCQHCPIVVLDYDSAAEVLSFAYGSPGTFEFLAMGIVDLEAIPNNRQHMELGTDENPVPLVEFTNVGQDSPPKKAGAPQAPGTRSTERE